MKLFQKNYILSIDILCDTQYNNKHNTVQGGSVMNHDEVVSGLIQELRRGTLIILVLSQLKEPMYGYNLVKKLQENNIPIEANTLYPLMRRLESQGLLKSEWETSESKPRKYYKITDDGLIVLEKAIAHWKRFSKNVNTLLEVDNNEK